MRNVKHRTPATETVERDEILPEYDFSRAGPNKYASRYRKCGTVVTLDPDVAAVFPDAKRANEALRALAGIIRRHRSDRAQAHGNTPGQ